ncbi:hypothetical protein [Streptomyces sp. NRRL S-813]|uniref:hypothetical protein n=1 Tax=Streptomyces sp. NRRL S-813 TaxID=1463919 RepID=UPI0004BF7408|nr:hypothetical protein [Streptomyces sp. NRRL S-813]
MRLPSGATGYVVTRYDDVRTVLAGGVFSRAATVAPGAPQLSKTPPLACGLFTMDPPEHTQLRKLVLREFTNRRVQQLRPRIGCVHRAARRLQWLSVRLWWHPYWTSPGRMPAARTALRHQARVVQGQR